MSKYKVLLSQNYDQIWFPRQNTYRVSIYIQDSFPLNIKGVQHLNPESITWPLFSYDLLQEAFAVEQLLVLALLQSSPQPNKTALKRQDLHPPRLEEVVVRARGSEQKKKNPQRFSSRDCIRREKGHCMHQG